MRLRCVRVLDDRVDLVIEAQSERISRTNPGAAARLLEWLPGLASHHCSTQGARSFAEELCDTEDAHLLEHVVLELLHRAGASPDIHGETVWRKGDDAYCVSIYDDDDVLCLLATRLALRIIDAAAGDDPAPDIGAEVAGLISRCDDGLSSARD